MFSEVVMWRLLPINLFRKRFAKFKGKSYAGVPYLIKLQYWLATLGKTDSSTTFFQNILRNFIEELLNRIHVTAEKIKFFIQNFFSKCNQIRRKQWIWSHSLKKPLMEKFIFCSVCVTGYFCTLVFISKPKIQLTSNITKRFINSLEMSNPGQC